MEAVTAITAVSGSDSGGAIAPLFQTNVAVGGVVVGGRELEFNPGGWEGGTALDAAFEGCGERDEGGSVGADGSSFFRVGEVGTGGAVAIPEGTGEFGAGLAEEESLPEVVVEVVCAGFSGFIGEDNTGPAVVVLAGGVLDKPLLIWTVGHVGGVAWDGIAI